MDLDLSGYLYVVFALIFVVALIVLIATLARRFGLGYSGGSKSGGERRLNISEVLTLSPKHRLVLIKRDDTEHLLLLGANTDLVVEGNITKTRFSEALQEATLENKND
jgi:flagellar protein FliO/FliZ